MSEKVCYNCNFKNDDDADDFCQECGSPLDLSEYIEYKKLNKNIIEKIKSFFGKSNIEEINQEIEEFIKTSVIIWDYDEDLGNLKSGNFKKSEFNNKYKKLLKLKDLHYLDRITKDEDLNNKLLRINSIESCLDNYDKIEQFDKEYNDLVDSNFYVTFKQKDYLSDTYIGLHSLIKSDDYLKNDFKEFLEIYSDLDSLIESRNEEYVQNELKEHKDFFDDIGGKSLDDNQRFAVVRNEHNSQIIAGAGCGKTLTVNAKVRYLIEKKGISPNDILCLSFSNLSVNDLRESLPEDVEISTFHSLGASILRANHQPSRVDENALTNFIKDYFKNNVINNKELCSDIVDFFAYYLYSPITEDQASTLGEMYDLENSRDFRTLRDLYGGDKEKITYDNKNVKSFEELIIANYLFAHKIDYDYEKVYESDNKYYSSQKEFIFNLIFGDLKEIIDFPVMMDKLLDNLFKVFEIKRHVKLLNYIPDFYLKENNIYLEHFGVNKECNALWLDKKGQQKYKKGINWKREIHKLYGSTLIETYSYYSSENRLLSRLEEKLQDCGVEIKEVDYEWLFSKIIERDDVNKFNNLINLIKEFIELFKGNDYDITQFSKFKKENEITENEFDKKRADLFLNIVECIYLEYEKYLKEISRIDFNDMINHATREVEKGNLHKNFRYILVDEYQDTSYTRYNLVKAIQDKTEAKLSVVGDDWQSIYRFTGCDVSLFSQFEKFFENPDKLTIDTTYRNSQELIDISGRFISKNPNQIDKSLNSMKESADKPVKIAYYNNSSKEDKIKTMKFLIDEISKESSDIMILGRNNFDINDFIEAKLFKRLKSDESKLIYSKNENLNIDFISVHKSKGLEKDNVILINLENNIVGFPNQIRDDKLLNFVINDSDQFPYAEERRLFYVALTRTKNNVYLLVPQTEKSEFVKELEKNIDDLDIISNESEEKIYDDMIEFMKNKKFYSIKTDLKCPVCKTGDVLLKIIKSKDGEDIFKFFDCSHRRCEWNGGYYYSDLKLLDEIEICPDCGKVRYIADGRYGPYIRCSKGCKKQKLTDEQLKRANVLFNEDDDVNNEFVETELNCPKCGKGKVILKINSRTKKQQFVCSDNSCDWDGGIFDRTGKIDTIRYCNIPKCNGITYIRDGVYGSFRSCSNYFKTGCKGKINSYSKKEGSSSKWKKIKVDLSCPSCSAGEVILVKNKETGKGFFKCTNDNCDWYGGSFNRSEDLLNTLDYCTECDGLTYEIKRNNYPFKVCTNFAKTRCNAGKR